MPLLPILYSFRRCPYAMRARLALYSAKIDHQHREVSLKNKPLEMLEISPKGTVPVLQINEKMILEESLDIMNWALSTPNLSLRNSQLIIENDTIFKPTLDRYKYPGRYEEEEQVNYRDKGEAFLKQLDMQLNPFLAGDVMTLPDMAIFPFIRQFAGVDPEWFIEQNYPALQNWLNLCVSSSLFQKIMYKFCLWSVDDSATLVTF